MSMSFQVAVDSQHAHVLADWWAETLGWQVEAHDPAFIRSMVEQGDATGEETATHRGELVWRAGAAVVHPDGLAVPGGRIFFQQVPEGKSGKNRLHLDLRSAPGEPGVGVEQLLERGAAVLGEGRQGPYSWTVMADPEGNEFCVSS